MQRFAVETPPKPLSGVTITVYNSGTETLAVIYTDRNGTTPKPNPFTIPTNGEWEFYARGRYDVVLGGTASAPDKMYNNGQKFVCEDVLIFDQDEILASESAAEAAASSASESELKAQKWAEEGENLEVELGKYSAKHHSAKAASSATASANSASSALSYKDSAAISATNAYESSQAAGTSASSAASSASAASTSATNAASSATSASNSASASAASALDSAASASSAELAEANALASKNAAATSETNAATSEANALAYKNAAATSETNAANSDAAALASKNAAATSETNAAGSASAAATSATNAAGSATTATNAKTAAEAARDKASLWADQNADIIVEGTAYSAKHWATKAEQWAAGAMHYKGVWNASTGVYPTSPVSGDLWKISVAGTISGVPYQVGDAMIYNGASWDRIDGSDAVSSVAGRTGAVTLSAADIAETSDRKWVTSVEKAYWNAKASTDLATVTTDGLMSATDKVKLTGVAENANNYIHPATHPTSLVEGLDTRLDGKVDVFTTKTGLLIPFYHYPWDDLIGEFGDWSALFLGLLDTLKKYHDVPACIIVNPESGPGTYEDTIWRRAIKKLQGAGAVVIGYVGTDYTTRLIADVKAEIATWQTYYPHLDGIFLDEMTNADTQAYKDYYADVTNYSHGLGFFPIVANPGTAVPPSYFTENTADIIVTWETDTPPSTADIEGDWQEDSYSEIMYSRRAVLIYNQPTLDKTLLTSLQKHTGLVYITDDVLPNPWDTLPTYFSELMSSLAINSENEPAFTKNTAFNKNFGTAAGTVAEGNHLHDNRYYTETEINSKLANSANWDSAYTHKSSTGVDHTYINQDVTTTSKPSFSGVNVSSKVDIVYNTTTNSLDFNFV